MVRLFCVIIVADVCPENAVGAGRRKPHERGDARGEKIRAGCGGGGCVADASGAGDARRCAQRRPGYSIRSLYFDTLDDQDFWDKIEGIELRRKIRLRIYSPADTVSKLEMKQKQGPYQKKRSLAISRADALALCAGDYSPLLRYSDPFAAECYGLMHNRCYRPRTIVEYRRQAFIARENNIRLTFDSDIRATEASMALFAEDLALTPVLDPFSMVLEVKFNGFLLSYIKNLLDTVHRPELSVSKYCLARRFTMGIQPV